MAVSYSIHAELLLKAPEAGPRAGGGSGADSAPPSPVLHIRVSRVLYPVTIDTIVQVFRSFGDLRRVVIFAKNEQFCALVELESEPAAVAALAALDSQFIYPGCNQLHIAYSRLPSLAVKYNNDKSRDFTNPGLPPGPPPGPGLQGPGGGGGAAGPGGGGVAGVPVYGYPGMGYGAPHHPASPGYYDHSGMYYDGAPVSAPSPVVIVTGFDPEKVGTRDLFNLLGVYGNVVRVKKLFKAPGSALVQFFSAARAQTARSHLNGCRLFGSVIRVNISTHFSISNSGGSEASPDKPLTEDFSTSDLHRYRDASQPRAPAPPSSSVYLAGLPLDATIETVSSLCSPFGPVKSVRLVDPKDPATATSRSAIVDMTSTNDAVSVIVKLHNQDNVRVCFAHTRHSP